MSEGPRPVPRATYRLQLSKDFTFRDVEGVAGYLGALGVSHAYLSPILEARPGSTHGYDTVDHTRINPELGTLEDFRRMAQTLRASGLSIVLDIVPNHMGIGGDRNALWLDVLEWGRSSPYAEWFDINWDPSEPTLKDKLLVPFLGSAYGQALQDGKLELRFDEAEGAFAIWAEGSHKLPVCPTDYGRILQGTGTELAALGQEFGWLTGASESVALKERLATHHRQRPEAQRAIQGALASFNDGSGRELLAALIARQNWRPSRASVAADDINYRRFFIVSDLAAIRIEREDVFDHVHALPFQLVEEGLVDGLRVDHIDGLYDPKAYCRALRAKCPRPIYLVVEKILAPHEQLRPDWDVEGTTGYEFASTVTRLLTDPTGERSLTATYEEFTGRTDDLEHVERDAKLGIIDFEMAAELDALTVRLRSIAASDPLTADFTRNTLRNALRSVVASLPVYRTYVSEDEVTDADKRTIGLAVAKAQEATPAIDPSAFSFIESVLGGGSDALLEAAMRVQQYTGPVMAKGLEDTALYRFNRLIALSDVGEKPDRFTGSVASFHDFMKSRVLHQRHGMLTSSSHDTKRGEDTRSRIAALSGHADDWATCVSEWTALLSEQGASDLERNDLYYFFQLVIGAWPARFPAQTAIPETSLALFAERLEAAMLKSVREARLRTNWTVPRTEYEERVKALVQGALSPDPNNAFLAAVRAFEDKIAWDGAQNGLIETVLKLTVPGVPDIYQGAELWEQSMVDPDNRRPVDYAERRTLFRALSDCDLPELTRGFRSGGIKLALMSRLLNFRARYQGLFANGTYEPVEIFGRDADRIVAFRRQSGSARLFVAASLGPWRGPPSGTLRAEIAGVWHDVLRGKEVATSEDLGELLREGLPVAVLAAQA